MEHADPEEGAVTVVVRLARRVRVHVPVRRAVVRVGVAVQPPGAPDRREPDGDEHDAHDALRRGGESLREAQPREDDRAADEEDRRRVPERPARTEAGGVPPGRLAARERGHRGKMIGPKGMLGAEDQCRGGEVPERGHAEGYEREAAYATSTLSVVSSPSLSASFT